MKFTTVAGILLLAFVVSACETLNVGGQNTNTTINRNTAATDTNTNQNTNSAAVVNTNGAENGNAGRELSGGASPVREFTKAEYDAAVAGNKNIVLYFYANWCPTCKAEIPVFYSAMQQFNDENTVGFRVNFNDTETDEDEKALAREFGVAYQHTKVLLTGKVRMLKSPETWDAERYSSEMLRAFRGSSANTRWQMQLSS